MDAENSILESCGEDSILIQTVKNIIKEDTHDELGSGEEGFYVVANMESEQPSMIQISNTGQIGNQHQERLIWSDLCRVCANVNDHFISIFQDEGLQYDLSNKIHKYLPIHVSENDTLPLQLCYHCAATLLAWHELSEGCLNAERRLMEMQDTSQEKQQYFNATSSDGLQTTSQERTLVPNTTESHSEQQIIVKDEACADSAINDINRWKTGQRQSNDVHVHPYEITSTEETEYFECAQCSIVFVDMKRLTNHMNTEHDIQVHYCQYCKLFYRGQIKDFAEHISMHCSNYEVSKDSLQEVRMFEEVSETPKQFEENEVAFTKSAHVEKASCYTCHLCDKTFMKKSELKKHIDIHFETKQIQNSDEIELLNKAKQMIGDRVSYRCDTCEKLMLTKRGFLRHIRVHSGKRPCKCNVCGKCYRIEQDLARHVRDVHEGLKKYACDICGRAFANKGAKDDHRRIHTGERPYGCEHCPKTFRTLNSIYIHNRVHTNYKPHKCSYCGKYFRSKQRLTNHQTTHTGIKAFSCEVCGKTFSVKGEVMRHRAIHSVEKPFDCKSCGMKYGQKRYLRNHIKQHHKEESTLLLSELSEHRN